MKTSHNVVFSGVFTFSLLLLGAAGCGETSDSILGDDLSRAHPGDGGSNDGGAAHDGGGRADGGGGTSGGGRDGGATGTGGSTGGHFDAGFDGGGFDDAGLDGGFCGSSPEFASCESPTDCQCGLICASGPDADAGGRPQCLLPCFSNAQCPGGQVCDPQFGFCSTAPTCPSQTDNFNVESSFENLFTLSNVPDQTTLSVSVGGYVVPSSEWFYQPASNSIVFEAGAIYTGAAIAVSYVPTSCNPLPACGAKENNFNVEAPAESTFTLSDLPVLGTIEVQVNGSALSAALGFWTYDSTSNAIVFSNNTYLYVGSEISVVYALASCPPEVSLDGGLIFDGGTSDSGF